MFHATDSQILVDCEIAEEMIVEFAHITDGSVPVVIPPWITDTLDRVDNRW